MINSLQAPVVKKLPSMSDSRPLLSMLFGSDTVCALRKVALLPDECVVVASYADADGVVRRLLVCDLPFANSAGASLTAIPPVAALNATKAKKLAENVVENLYEVMNIAVNLMIETFGSRLELSAVQQMSDVRPEVKAALNAEQRSKFDVAIPKYEKGRIDILAVEIPPATI